jgi:calcineurin-like phosphoesterase family protein
MPLRMRNPRRTGNACRPLCFPPGDAFIRLLIAVLVLAPLFSALSPRPVTGQADDPVCATSGPQGGAYEVNVCLSLSWTGQKHKGDANVEASIEATNGSLPAIVEVEFTMARDPSTKSFDILTDYAPPYEFALPTKSYTDGSYRLGVAVEFADKFKSKHPQMNVTFANGQAEDPKVSDTWQPTSGRPGNPFVVAVVGDGAGGLPGADAVANLIGGWKPNLLLYLGDVYNFGTYPEFYNYYQPTLGRLKAITDPVIGNHEAGGSGFQGFYEYWNTHRHYYAFDAAGWHFVGIDNTDTYQQLNPGDPQYDWLADDLRAHAGECTIVFMHHPRFGLAHSADNVSMQAIWQLMVDNDVELALTGHEHNYQRWQPMNGFGEVDPNGVTQIVIGTGGHELEPFRHSDGRVAAAIEKRDGALRMVLTPDGADYRFIATDGSVLDSGSTQCSVPGAVTLSKYKGKTGGRIGADFSHFTANSDITLAWVDGKVLGTARTDGDGNGHVTFRTPSAAYGTYDLTATDGSGVSGTAQFVVIPRVKITKESVPAGSDLRVYLYGFSARSEVEIRLSRDGSEGAVSLATVTTAKDGSASVVVTIPPGTKPGEYSLIARATSGQQGSTSTGIRVTAAPVVPRATPVPGG